MTPNWGQTGFGRDPSRILRNSLAGRKPFLGTISLCRQASLVFPEGSDSLRESALQMVPPVTAVTGLPQGLGLGRGWEGYQLSRNLGPGELNLLQGQGPLPSLEGLPHPESHEQGLSLLRNTRARRAATLPSAWARRAPAQTGPGSEGGNKIIGSGGPGCKPLPIPLRDLFLSFEVMSTISHSRSHQCLR